MTFDPLTIALIAPVAAFVAVKLANWATGL